MNRKRCPLLLAISLVFIICLPQIGSTSKGLAQAIDTPAPLILGNNEELQKAKRETLLENPFPVQAEAKNPAPVEVGEAKGIDAWSKIAYQYWAGSDYEIMLAKGDGVSPTRLTLNPAFDGYPRLNRGATQIVFVSNRDGDNEIFTMNVDGTNVRQITFNTSSDLSPYWSPDSSRIVYMSKEAGHYEIYSINADGSGKTRMTHTAVGDCASPSWSPDGTLIAYSCLNDKGFGRVWLMPSSGGSSTAAIDYDVLFPYDPVFSPDGEYLAFDSADTSTYFTTNIHVVILSSRYSYMILSGNSYTYEDRYVGSWSPDSEQVLFNRIKYVIQGEYLVITEGILETRCYQIGSYCVRPDARLSGTGLDFQPDWQSADLIPPESTLVSLPKYVRKNGFVLKWETAATGLAALAGHNLEFRINNSGDWLTWYTYSDLSFQEWIDTFWYATGDQISFRLSAYDEAGNIEPFTASPTGDTSAILFTSLLSGELKDPRGFPLPGAQLTILPAPIEQKVGNTGYQAWMADPADDQSYQYTVQVAGYGSLPTSSRTPYSDFAKNFYLPSQDNLLTNSNFETGTLQGWALTTPITATGELTVEVNNTSPFTGQFAVTLGAECENPCLIQEEIWNASSSKDLAGEEDIRDDASLTPEGPMGASSDMAVASDGTVYVAAWKIPGLYVTSRSPSGVWSTPVLLDPNYSSSWTPTYVNISPTGEVLVFWVSPQTSQRMLARKLPSKPWEVSAAIPEGVQAMDLSYVTFDQSGGLYLLANTLAYAYRSPAGSWQFPISHFSIYESNSMPAMAVTADKTKVFFWFTFDGYREALYTRTVKPDGSVTDPLRIHVEKYAPWNSHILAETDQEGNVHLFYEDGPNIVHLIRYANGSWSHREGHPGISRMPYAVQFQGDTIHTAGFLYQRREPDQGWITPITLPDLGLSMVIDPKGIFHFAGLNYSNLNIALYSTTAKAAALGQVTLAQTVTLPENIHKPTLSFAARWRGAIPASESYYEVVLSDGATTQVIPGTAGENWQQHWFELDEWSGRQVTVAFTVYQKAGEPYVFLDLDDLSIGAWETPVIVNVAPSAVLPPTLNQIITISGDNFIQKPAVFLNQVRIQPEKVTWVDERTLTVWLPSGLGTGAFHVKVVNPGGQFALAQNAVRIGYFLNLPMVRR